jgi:Nif-specific ferredoxin III
LAEPLARDSAPSANDPFKACGRSVLGLVPIDEDGEVAEDEENIERHVMTLAGPGDRIGCGACSRVCAMNCQKHGVAQALEVA